MVATLALCAGCSGPTDTLVVTSLEVVSGGNQNAPPGSVLPDPVVIRVEGSNGAGVSGQHIDVQVKSGGGTVSPTSATSDAQGLVRVTWTLGPQLDSQVLEARATGNAVGGSATFTNVSAGVIRPIPAVVSSPQFATVGTHLPPIVLQFKDSTGAPIPNYTFTLRSLSCSLSNGLSCNDTPADDQLTNPTVTTGTDGTVSFGGWTLGTTVGDKCLGLYPGTSTPQNALGVGPAVCVIAEPGPPAQLARLSANDQQAPSGTTLTIAIRVEDQYGNQVGCWFQTTVCVDPNAPEVQVTFAPSSGSSVSPSQATTERGTAFTDWTLAAGANALTISVGSLSLTYTATGT